MSVQFRELSRRYAGGRGIDTASADIAAGTLCAVVGGNGAGKSTLLRCLAGTVRCRGVASVAGQAPGRARRGAVGYLPQGVVLPPRATVGEIVAVFSRLGGAAEPELDRDLVSVAPGRLMRELSGGEQQRVALAALLAMRPAVLLLDEPFAALDGAARAAALARLRSACDGGATVLVASPAPDLADLRLIMDRVLLLESGRIVADGGPELVAREAWSA